MTLTRVFAPITKSITQDDGSRLVYGKMTGPDLDLDGQRCDADWLKTAVPDWFKVGNVREMHQAWAVGKGLELEPAGDDFHLTSKVVDAEAIKKLDAGIYTGYSIGIRSPKIRKDASAPNGLIYGGVIIEVSLADAPCNDTCKLTLIKTVGGVPTVTKTDAVADPASDETIEGNVDDPPAGDEPADDALAGDEPAGDDAGDLAAELDLLAQATGAIKQLLVGEVAELAEGTGGLSPVRILMYVLDELMWFAECDSYDDAMQRIEAAKVAGNEDTVNLTALATLTKAATAADASDTDKAAVAELRKALGIDAVETKISTELTKVATAEDLMKVAVRLTKVEETVVSTGPVRVRPEADLRKASAADAARVQVADLRKLAATVTDREMSAAYTRRADALEAEANRKDPQS